MNTQTPGGQLNNAILDGRVPPVTAEQRDRVRSFAAVVADEQGWRADLAMVLDMLAVV